MTTKRHYSETLQGLLDMGSKEIVLTPKEAKNILRDFETLKELRRLAGTTPCDLCLFKGGSNIEADGGCRHRPSLDTHLTDQEVIHRLEPMSYYQKETAP